MSVRADQIAVRLAAFQVVDALGNEVVPRRYIERHLDHLGVPQRLRPMLSPIKVTTAAGLVIRLRVPAVGALAAAGLVAYYSAAASFHMLAKDHPLLAGAAVACGAAAAITLVRLYMPKASRHAR